MPIRCHVYLMCRLSVASATSGGDLVQSHNQSVACALKCHHAFEQIQESQALLSLCRPKGIAVD